VPYCTYSVALYGIRRQYSPVTSFDGVNFLLTRCFGREPPVEPPRYNHRFDQERTSGDPPAGRIKSQRRHICFSEA
jgi:hypothetical protein